MTDREKRSQEYHTQFWADVRALVDAGHEVVVRPLYKKSRVAALPAANTRMIDFTDAATIELRDPADEPEPYAEGVSFDAVVEDLLRKAR